jgi:hypothetical protein
MKLDWNHWLYSLGKAVIGGVASAGAAWCGTALGHSIAPGTVPVMNWSSLGFVVLTSTVSNLFFFLKQSPLPKDLDEKNHE